LGYSIVHLDDIEPGGPGGAVRFVRRALAVRAFGINWYELPPGAVGREHDETDTGQEEVNVVIRGSGTYRIDGEEVPVHEGTFLRFDPETLRVPIAGPDGLTLIAVGARRGSYEPRGPC
jgi:quercetin dioxygenase-like cupin family protein